MAGLGAKQSALEGLSGVLKEGMEGREARGLSWREGGGVERRSWRKKALRRLGEPRE